MDSSMKNVLCSRCDSIVLMLLGLVRSLVNNMQCWTWWPFSFVILTCLVQDNFEVKDKKRKMYPWGLWNSCEEPQKQHFIRGTIQHGDQQYMGEFKWEALCEWKAKEICLVLGPFLLFNHRLMSDFDVDKMIEKQSGVARFNPSGE